MEQNLSEIRKRIIKACERSQRDPNEVHLLAVSKMQPDHCIEEAYALGIRDFGENYAQELLRKKKMFDHLNGVRWHMIGPLQRNKVKNILGVADFFHALDQESLLSEFQKRSEALNSSSNLAPLKVFIEVNVDDETSKAGVPLSQVRDLAKKTNELKCISLAGLMCIPSPTGDVRKAFQKMAALRSELQEEGIPLALSMGMSGDYEIAIEEGSNWIRLGTALFGERKK